MTLSQRFKIGSKWRNSSPKFPFLYLIQKFQVAARSTSPDITVGFLAWTYGRFLEIQSNPRRKKLHRTSQGFNFLGGSSSNKYDVKSLNPVWKRGQPQHLKKWFSLKNIPIFFHRPVKLIQLSFPSIEDKNPLPALVYSLSQMIFRFRGQF